MNDNFHDWWHSLYLCSTLLFYVWVTIKIPMIIIPAKRYFDSSSWYFDTLSWYFYRIWMPTFSSWYYKLGRGQSAGILIVHWYFDHSFIFWLFWLINVYFHKVLALWMDGWMDVHFGAEALTRSKFQKNHLFFSFDTIAMHWLHCRTEVWIHCCLDILKHSWVDDKLLNQNVDVNHSLFHRSYRHGGQSSCSLTCGFSNANSAIILVQRLCIWRDTSWSIQERRSSLGTRVSISFITMSTETAHVQGGSL